MSLNFAEEHGESEGSAGALNFEQATNTLSLRASSLPRLEDIPIPEGVQVGPSGWGDQMIEMADHIGPYLTLLVVERYGGRQVYISADPKKNALRELIGAEAAAIMSHVYRREVIEIPTARCAVNRARRAGILAAVRAGLISGSAAAVVVGTSRTYLSYLVNQTDEGVGVKPITLPLPRETALLLNAANIIGEALAEVGAGHHSATVAERILQLADKASDALREALARFSSSSPPNDGSRYAE